MAKGQVSEKLASVEFDGAGGVVKVGSKNYAVGLIWEGIEEGKIYNLARDSAHAHGADLICVRKPAKRQYGLASTSTGHRQGMVPLAAILSESIDGSFVGAFEIPNGFYLFAIREDMILAGNDRIIASRDEAIEAFQELALAMSWNQSVCPKNWGLDGTTEEPLDNLIFGFKPKTRLEAVSQTGKVIKLVGAASLAVLFIGGFLVYEHHLADIADEQRAAAARQRAEEDARMAAQRNQFVLPAMPWEGNPSGVPVIIACVDNILDAAIDVPGWSVKLLKCHLNSAVVTPTKTDRPVTTRASLAMSMVLARVGGTINWIGAALNRDDFHPAVVVAKDGTADVSWTVPAPSPDFGPEQSDMKTSPAVVGNVMRANKYFVTQFDEVYTQVDLREADGPVVKVPVGRGNFESVIPEHHLAFSFKTRHNPKEFVEILSHIPALEVTDLSLDPVSWMWNVGGVVYERRPVSTSARTVGVPNAR